MPTSQELADRFSAMYSVDFKAFLERAMHDAWQEGYDAGGENEPLGFTVTNPYVRENIGADLQ